MAVVASPASRRALAPTAQLRIQRVAMNPSRTPGSLPGYGPVDRTARRRRFRGIGRSAGHRSGQFAKGALALAPLRPAPSGGAVHTRLPVGMARATGGLVEVSRQPFRSGAGGPQRGWGRADAGASGTSARGDRRSLGSVRGDREAHKLVHLGPVDRLVLGQEVDELAELGPMSREEL